jgi:hypothetical protein
LVAVQVRDWVLHLLVVQVVVVLTKVAVVVMVVILEEQELQDKEMMAEVVVGLEINFGEETAAEAALEQLELMEILV